MFWPAAVLRYENRQGIPGVLQGRQELLSTCQWVRMDCGVLRLAIQFSELHPSASMQVDRKSRALQCFSSPRLFFPINIPYAYTDTKILLAIAISVWETSYIACI